MDSPYLESGESIVLTTDRVSINSLQYDLLLTTKYLILIDIRYARFLPEKIPLMTVLSVKAGKIATGDPAITLYFFDKDQTSGTDQMNLIFSRQPGEERGRERDEWLRKLMELVVASRQASGPREAPAGQDAGIRPAQRRQIAPEMQLPHSTIIESRPEPIELAILPDEPEPPASEEGPVTAEEDFPAVSSMTPSHPESRAPETPETFSQEISGEDTAVSGSFESAGTGEKPDGSRESPEPPDGVSGGISDTAVPEVFGEELTGSVTGSELAPPEMPPADSGAPEFPDLVPGQPEISVPMISPEQPAGSATIPDTAPADETLADSRAQPESIDRVPEEPEITAPVTSPGEPPGSVTIPDIPSPEGTPADFPAQPVSPDREPGEPESITPVAIPEEPAGAVTIPEIQTPDEIIPASPEQTPSQEPSRIESHGSVEESAGRSLQESQEEGGQPQEPADRSEAENIPPGPGSSPQPGDGHTRQTTFILAAAILVLILGIAGFAVFSPAGFGAPSGILPPVPTTPLPETLGSVPSTPVTPVPTPLIIPTTGVWVRVTYPQNFYGRLGNPGSLREVSGSGDRLYQMNEGDHLVQVQMYKTDNSGDTLAVEIYRNGESMTRRTTTSPMGFIDLLVDSTTGAPPGIPPRVTQSPGPFLTDTQTPQVSRTTLPPVNRTTPTPGLTIAPMVNQTPRITNQTNSTRVMYF